MKRFIKEIGARSLGAILGVYLAVSLVILRVILALENSLVLPSWVFIAAVMLLSIGLPIVLSTAFVQSVASGRALTAGGAAGPSDDAAAIHRVFTWRNALVGGFGGFTALVIGTVAWILAGPALPSVEPSAAATVEVTEGAPEVQAERAFRSLVAAIRAMDVEGTLAAYDDAPDFSYVFDAELVEGREAFDAVIRASFGALREVEVWDIEDLRVSEIDEDHVLITSRFREVAIDTIGSRLDVRGVVTNVMVRRPSGWRVMNGHTTAAVEVPPP